MPGFFESLYGSDALESGRLFRSGSVTQLPAVGSSGATVYSLCSQLVGYGDADPSNVSPLVRGAEMRVAETRAGQPCLPQKPTASASARSKS